MIVGFEYVFSYMFVLIVRGFSYFLSILIDLYLLCFRVERVFGKRVSWVNFLAILDKIACFYALDIILSKKNNVQKFLYDFHS